MIFFQKWGARLDRWMTRHIKGRQQVRYVIGVADDEAAIQRAQQHYDEVMANVEKYGGQA